MCPIVPTFTCGFERSNFSFAIAISILPFARFHSLQNPGVRSVILKQRPTSIVRVYLQIPLPKLFRHALHQPQIPLARQRLVRNRQRRIERRRFLAQKSSLQHPGKIPDPQPGTFHPVQQHLNITRIEGRVKQRMQLRVPFSS